MVLNAVDRIICKYEYGLDEEKQRVVEAKYATANTIELARECYDNPYIDEHSREYDKMRKFIARLKRGINSIEFTKEQLTYITNNAAVMRPIDMAKTLFPEKKIQPLSGETKTIISLVAALNIGPGTLVGSNSSNDYTPPKDPRSIIKKINDEDINANYCYEDLSAAQKKNIQSLRGYLHSKRFNNTIQAIRQEAHRNLFEGTFIQSTYDKSDLNAEELNMYISLCRDYVFGVQIQEQMEAINEEADNQVDTEESAGLRRNLIELYSKKMEEYNKVQIRMKNLQIDLSDKRSTRIKNTAELNSSLSKFVELWKSEEERKKAIIIAKARNLEVVGEVERIATAAEYIASVMGISQDELMNN